MMYKNVSVLLFLVWVVVSCQSKQSAPVNESSGNANRDSTESTNDFYDNEPTYELGGADIIQIGGEVAQPVAVRLGDLPIRSVIVKETRMEAGEVRFTGAYRYDGISLYDILNQVKVVKKNESGFKPIIDQYVVVFNPQGDSVVISWGEIYYPNQRHQILIASRVMRIVPSKTLDQWPLPDQTRLIVGPDLVTERNISAPVRIEVRSLAVNYPVNRDIKMWSPEVAIVGAGIESLVLSALPEGIREETIKQVFYGRGKGIHGISSFRGAYLKELLVGQLPLTQGRIRHGLFVLAAVDGYRCAMTYSELMNRNDNAEVILIDEDNYEQAGRFSCLFAADFFSDRAIKSITEIRLLQGNEE